MSALADIAIDPIRCPLCAATDRTLIGEYTVAQAARHFCSETRNADRNRRMRDCLARLWPDGVCRVYECRACGFGYGWPFVGGDEAFYAILHEQHGYPADRWEYRVTLARLAPAPPHAKALDIGAGVGRFLTQLGPEWHRFALESAETTRRALAAKGIAVLDDFAGARAAGPFALITMFQVLEHLSLFHDVLAHCRAAIAADGRLVVSVPSGPAMRAQEEATGWPDMPPNHINKWTPASLTRALTDAGFAVEDVLHEAPSLATVRNTIYLRLLTDALAPSSFAALIYRIGWRPLRIALLPLAAIGAAAMLVPHWRYFGRSGSFMIVARPR